MDDDYEDGDQSFIVTFTVTGVLKFVKFDQSSGNQ